MEIRRNRWGLLAGLIGWTIVSGISCCSDDYMDERSTYAARVVEKYHGSSRYGLEFLLVVDIKGQLHSIDVGAAEYTVAEVGQTRHYSLLKRFYEPDQLRANAFTAKMVATLAGIICLVSYGVHRMVNSL